MVKFVPDGVSMCVPTGRSIYRDFNGYLGDNRFPGRDLFEIRCYVWLGLEC